MEQNTDLSINKKQKSYKLYENIEFTQKESELFDYLINFIKEKKLDLVLRCVGGFVRDKLLQLESEDIDIALDKMTGEQFVLMLKQNFEEKGEHLHNIHIIKSNPEKSKHLETATCNIFGFEVDFVNLRGEEYAQNSRIPTQTTFGSPYEDALRRDLTINALFYNINEEKLEDFTERGLTDLKNGVCMTPMDPLKTFIDDPLRIIRTIRFMSRYNFTIDKTVFETMKLEQVRNALKLKVSPERIGKEITKLLKGNNPYMAIQAIKDSDLWEILAPINEKCEELINDQNASKSCLELSEKLTDSIKQNFDQCIVYSKDMEDNFSNEDYPIVFYLSAIVYPFQPYSFPRNKKGKPELVVHDILVDQHRCSYQINEMAELFEISQLDTDQDNSISDKIFIKTG
ncbi:hypothetical protein PPERSA_11391 [Pseudocohnilembus persalinus]|uniref:Poly A polymerase, head domain n=1 Tax=Pseudocohnilembus persalinus TaxID=266149 RepID=A0A0V0QPR1_PSEPJ|nr:hypothetical protein PPERSA_11391 [Pseudocohnilembus persalinus]|eukprot:KRX04267.1 hypothetical protein PPERSA_11391 [Pseudocohnilembus persalinus]